jgi:transcriptional regulator with XRE-family HTH domain
VFLTAWRENAGVSQEQLGNRIQPPVDKGTVSRWENAPPGRLTLGVIAAFAEALDLHPTQLYRPPPPKDAGPSLESLIADLDEEGRSRTIGYVEGLKDRKAS